MNTNTSYTSSILVDDVLLLIMKESDLSSLYRFLRTCSSYYTLWETRELMAILDEKTNALGIPKRMYPGYVAPDLVEDVILQIMKHCDLKSVHRLRQTCFSQNAVWTDQKQKVEAILNQKVEPYFKTPSTWNHRFCNTETDNYILQLNRYLKVIQPKYQVYRCVSSHKANANKDTTLTQRVELHILSEWWLDITSVQLITLDYNYIKNRSSSLADRLLDQMTVSIGPDDLDFVIGDEFNEVSLIYSLLINLFPNPIECFSWLFQYAQDNTLQTINAILDCLLDRITEQSNKELWRSLLFYLQVLECSSVKLRESFLFDYSRLNDITKSPFHISVVQQHLMMKAATSYIKEKSTVRKNFLIWTHSVTGVSLELKQTLLLISHLNLDNDTDLTELSVLKCINVPKLLTSTSVSELYSVSTQLGTEILSVTHLLSPLIRYSLPSMKRRAKREFIQELLLQIIIKSNHLTGLESIFEFKGAIVYHPMKVQHYQKVKERWCSKVHEYILHLKRICVIELVELLCSSIYLSTSFMVSLLYKLAMRGAGEDIVWLFAFLTNPVLKKKIGRNGALGLWEKFLTLRLSKRKNIVSIEDCPGDYSSSRQYVSVHDSLFASVRAIFWSDCVSSTDLLDEDPEGTQYLIELAKESREYDVVFTLESSTS